MRNIFSCILIKIFLLIFILGSMSSLVSARPLNQEIQELSATDNSIWLIWPRTKSSDISYYNIYENGKYIGSTRDNFSSAITAFHELYAKDKSVSKDIASIHNYLVRDLSPNTDYKFSVQPMDELGNAMDTPIEILARTKLSKEVLNVNDFGAVGDGATLNTKAIQSAIDACTDNQEVYIPKGVYKTGALFLHSNITLKLAKDAVLLGSENPDDYVKNTEGKYSGLLNASNATNIKIIGEGTINGNGWQKDVAGNYVKANNKVDRAGIKDNNHVLNIGILAKNEVETALNAGDDFKLAYSKRSCLVNFNNVNEVYIEGITFENPAYHNISISDGKHIVLNNVQVKTYNANNADGIDFQGNGLLIANSVFDTGDDSINFNAGVGAEAMKKLPVGHAYIFNNYLKRGHGAVVLGSHTASWIESIVVEDNIIDGSDIALRCKTGAGIGGGGRNVLFQYNLIKDIQKQAFSFTSNYTDPNAVLTLDSLDIGIFRNFLIKDCVVYGANLAAIDVDAPDNKPYERLNFKNIIFYNTKPNTIKNLINSSFDNVTYETR